MKASSIISIVATTTILFTSCEKVIDYKLNDSKSLLVIEAQLSNDPNYSAVKLSKSINFEDSNTTVTVSKALVLIADNNGRTDTLTETSPGTYKPKLFAISGHTYTLTVVAEKNTYTAQSVVPYIVPLDSIGFSAMTAFGKKTYSAIPIYNDPAFVKNYYRFIETIDGEKADAIFVRNDNQTNGKTAKQVLRNFSGTEIKVGSRVYITMIGIDENVYAYFYSLSQISSNGRNSSGTPTNPVSNITGGALGYFSAQIVQQKAAMIIEE